MKILKDKIITIKIDKELSDALKGVKNKSEFVRGAILKSIESKCPLCLGKGIMTAEQAKHWKKFIKDHKVKFCPDCGENYIECRSCQDKKGE